MSLLNKSRQTFLIYVGLAILTLTVYWPVRHFEFINYDDDLNVTENRHVQQGLTADGVVWAFTTASVDYWRPLTWLTHMIDWDLHGAWAGGHHMTNVLLHVINALLLFAALNRMTRETWPSAFVAALFALHPLHVGSVAWVTERKDVLSGLFWMLCLIAYARYTERPGAKRYLLLILLFVCGLMSKPMVMTLPLILLALDFWPLRRGPSKPQIVRALVVEKLPLVALAAASTIGSYLQLYHTHQVLGPGAMPMPSRISNAVISYVRYIWKLFWPVGLSVHYPLIDHWPLLTTAAATTLLLTASAAAIRKRHDKPYLVVGWLWYLVGLLPVIGLVQGQDRASMADRYTYLPLTGLFVMIAWTMHDLGRLGSAFQLAARTAALAAIGFCTVVSSVQVLYWKDSISLFRRALGVTKSNGLAHYNLGCALLASGDASGAEQQLELAFKLDPHSAPVQCNLGLALIRQGKPEEAVEHWEEALRIQPDNAEALVDLGNVMFQQGRPSEAMQRYRQALAFDPDSIEAHNNLAALLLRQGKVKEAILHLQIALQINPDYVEARDNLARAQLMQ